MCVRNYTPVRATSSCENLVDTCESEFTHNIMT